MLIGKIESKVYPKIFKYAIKCSINYLWMAIMFSNLLKYGVLFTYITLSATYNSCGRKSDPTPPADKRSPDKIVQK
ncbi:hypothetical protein G293_01700 [Candidatus Liberibacter africanus PTSAPSY]|uniref:Uncharacterized protein n=1 Tax=Candidatus Liberibacter africanus PTSAPSY TaxID=1277257 RepID=A0A0G3I8C8_LIBAF|nr:hypothetical protein G293_01700 [Candidatus Liberibacter africanus PTSAPSY]